MSLLPRKALLAIAAVTDVALHARGRLVSARDLAARHDLPARHLEPVLQALVRAGILKGVRGPRGGYELARERKRISVEDILKAAHLLDGELQALPDSEVMRQAVIPAIAQAEKIFAAALTRITIDDLVRRVELQKDAGER